MEHHDAIAQERTEVLPGNMTWTEARIASTLKAILGVGTVGRLDVVMPSGPRIVIGFEDTGPSARVVMKSLMPAWRAATRGALGLAESYMRSEIDTPDLGAVLRFCLANFEQLEGTGNGPIRTRLWDRVWHQGRNNTRRGSRRNIAAHYDLGNEFYSLWLDPGMTYSSAIFRNAAHTLDEAQTEKNRIILNELNVDTGDRILEIGCGWGGLAEAAARRGVHVTGLTLSREQLSYASDRMRRAGLSALADLRFQDYRDCSGVFDAIASVEMIEAVGEAHWPLYFQTLHDRLKPGGRAVVQAITIDEQYFNTYRRKADFIQRYIFPGGMLPAVARMQAEAARAGLKFETVERFGSSYASTLVEWRTRFRAHWPEIQKLGFDERFRRMWEYYLTYCEVGFERGDVDAGIYRLTKPL